MLSFFMEVSLPSRFFFDDKDTSFPPAFQIKADRVLVGHLLRSLPLRQCCQTNAHRSTSVSATASKRLPSFTCSLASDRALATPHKRCRVCVPMLSDSLKPINDLRGVGWMLTI